MGFEPTTSTLATSRSTTELHPRITFTYCLGPLTGVPLSRYDSRRFAGAFWLLVERMTGLEPVTSCLASTHSTTELHPQIAFTFVGPTKVAVTHNPNYTPAEGRGFEPPGPCDPPSFQDGRFNHSRTLPIHNCREILYCSSFNLSIVASPMSHRRSVLLNESMTTLMSFALAWSSVTRREANLLAKRSMVSNGLFLRQMLHMSVPILSAEVAGFEPAAVLPALVFETSALSRTRPHFQISIGGRCGIRTHGPLSGPSAFKADAIGLSANLPFEFLASIRWCL